MTDENMLILSAIYETKCEQIQIAWLNPSTRSFINNGYAFAMSRRMYPYLQEDSTPADLFTSLYQVSPDLVKKVIDYLDEKWRDNPQSPDLNFYSLENHFGGHHVYRGELIAIIRYCSISGIFDDIFYNTVMTNAPIEAHNLTRDIDSSDIAIP